MSYTVYDLPYRISHLAGNINIFYIRRSVSTLLVLEWLFALFLVLAFVKIMNRTRNNNHYKFHLGHVRKNIICLGEMLLFFIVYI